MGGTPPHRGGRTTRGRQNPARERPCHSSWRFRRRRCYSASNSYAHQQDAAHRRGLFRSPDDHPVDSLGSLYRTCILFLCRHATHNIFQPFLQEIQDADRIEDASEVQVPLKRDVGFSFDVDQEAMAE